MSELYELPDGWEWKKLESIVKLKNGFAFKSKLFTSKGLPIVRIKNIKKERVSLEDVVYFDDSDYKNKLDNYKIQENDLLLAMSGATTGKIGLYKNKETSYLNQRVGLFRIIDKELRSYLFYFLSTQIEKNLAQSLGAAQPNLSSLQINEMKIPLPPLKEQKRIVSKLDTLFEKIDKAIELHEKNIKEADAFMGSVLNEVFEELEEKYEKKELFKIAEVNRGKSKHRPRNDKKLFGGKYPFIQTGDVRKANKYINSYENTYSEFGLLQSKLWKKGTICLTIAANIGDVAILDIESCFPDSIVGIYSNENSNDFLYYFFLTLKQHLESKATTTAQMNINLKVLQTIGIPLPSLAVQQKTVKYLDQVSQKIENTKAIQKEKLQNLKDLKASILDQAFKGQL